MTRRSSCLSSQGTASLHSFSPYVLVMRAWLRLTGLGVLVLSLISTCLFMHVSNICRSSFYHLSNLSRIRKHLTKESAAVVVHAFVTSKLDYCNALLYGLLKYQLQRLQYVQNTAARVVLQMSRFQHITPVLSELRWLPI